MGTEIQIKCPHCHDVFDEDSTWLNSGDTVNCVSCDAVLRVKYKIVVMSSDVDLVKAGQPELAHDYEDPEENENE